MAEQPAQKAGVCNALASFNLFQKPELKSLTAAERREAVCSTYSYLLGVISVVLFAVLWLALRDQRIPESESAKPDQPFIPIATWQQWKNENKTDLQCQCTHTTLHVGQVRNAITNMTGLSCPWCPYDLSKKQDDPDRCQGWPNE